MALETRRGFRVNHKNMARLLKGDISEHIAKRFAFEIRRDAANLARAEALDTGSYASSFEVRKAPDFHTTWGPHASYYVENSDPAAAPNEFGGRRNKERRILFRAAMKYHVPEAGVGKTRGF